MNRHFAYECYADHDVFLFLRDVRGLAIQKLHSYSQGEVINDLLVRGRTRFGMVDEDPHRTHHGQREDMEVVARGHEVELRRRADRHLLILKPELEECFLRSMARVQLASELPPIARELRSRLGIPNPDHSHHRRFRTELGFLYDEARRRHVPTFITELEDFLRPLV